MKNNEIPKYYRTSDLCGNCWGTQEYAGVIKRFRYDRKTDFNNHLKKRSFINGNEGRIGIVNKRSSNKEDLKQAQKIRIEVLEHEQGFPYNLNIDMQVRRMYYQKKLTCNQLTVS